MKGMIKEIKISLLLSSRPQPKHQDFERYPRNAVAITYYG